MLGRKNVTANHCFSGKSGNKVVTNKIWVTLYMHVFLSEKVHFCTHVQRTLHSLSSNNE